MLLPNTYLFPPYVHLSNTGDIKIIVKHYEKMDICTYLEFLCGKAKNFFVAGPSRAAPIRVWPSCANVPVHSWESLWHMKGTGWSQMFPFGLFHLLPSLAVVRAHLAQSHSVVLFLGEHISFWVERQKIYRAFP